MKYLYFSFTLLLFSVNTLISQDCSEPSDSLYFEVNSIKATVRSGELIWNDKESSWHGFEVPAGSGVHAVYAANTFMGGITADNLPKVAAGTYNSSGSDFYPGPLTIDGTATSSAENCEDYDLVFEIYEWQSLRHLIYFQALNDPNEDVTELFPMGYTVPEAFYEYPAHGNHEIQQDFYLAPFLDFNQDGSYFPEDGDCPLFSSMLEDFDCKTCEALNGHVATFWITNDTGGPHNSTGFSSLGVELHNSVYGFSTTDQNLDNTLFYQKKIINRGTCTYYDFYMGLWLDVDLGNPTDDYVGCDIGRNLGYVYNENPVDESTNLVSGYGENPPAFGVCQLTEFEFPGLTETSGMTSFTALTDQNFNTNLDYYNALNGLLAFQATTCETEDDIYFMYAGDTYENECDGSTEMQAGNSPGDRQFLLASHTQDMHPQTELCVTYGAIFAEPTEELTAVESLQSSTDMIQEGFDSCFECVPPKSDIQIEILGDLSFAFHNVASADTYSWDFGDGNTSDFAYPTHTFEPGTYTVTLTVSSVCGTDNHTVEIEVIPNSIDEIEIVFDIFPNPTSEVLNISFGSSFSGRLELVNSIGQIVKFDELKNTKNMKVDLNNLNKGIYVVRLLKENQSLERKIIIK